MLRQFVASLDAVQAEFVSAAGAADWAALRAQMHALKGTSATLGATRLADHAAHLEQLFLQAPAGLAARDEWPALQAVLQPTRAVAEQALHSLWPSDPALPAVERKPAGDAERARARECLSGWSDLLRASNLLVLDRFAEQRHGLEALAPADVAELHRALLALDLEQALRLCEQHIAALSEG